MTLNRFSFLTGIFGTLVVLPLLADRPSAEASILLTWAGHRMFEDFSARSEVSPDAQWVLRTFVDGNQALLHLPDGTSDGAANEPESGERGERHAQGCNDHGPPRVQGGPMGDADGQEEDLN